MKIISFLTNAAAIAALFALSFLSSCDTAENLVVTLPSQTVSVAGFQLRPTTPNTVYTDTAPTNPNAIYNYILTKYDTSKYSISNITVNKITITPTDGITQLGDLCQYLKCKVGGADVATTLDGYDTTAVSITLQPVPGGPSLESLLETLSNTPMVFECKTSDKGVESPLSLSLDVDMIIALDPNE